MHLDYNYRNLSLISVIWLIECTFKHTDLVTKMLTLHILFVTQLFLKVNWCKSCQIMLCCFDCVISFIIKIQDCWILYTRIASLQNFKWSQSFYLLIDKFVKCIIIKVCICIFLFYRIHLVQKFFSLNRN